MRALRDMNMPKFVYEDVPLFTGLINDLFPGVKADRVGYETLNGHIVDVLEKRGCKHSDDDLFYK
jgi:dynein heavy chain